MSYPFILVQNDYIRSHFSLIAVDLSKQKEVHADPKAIQQIEFIESMNRCLSLKS